MISGVSRVSMFVLRSLISKRLRNLLLFLSVCDWKRPVRQQTDGISAGDLELDEKYAEIVSPLTQRPELVSRSRCSSLHCGRVQGIVRLGFKI